MKRYMLLHFGFEKPTPELMQAWKFWFGSIADRTLENAGFHGPAREISHDGSRELVMDADCITGYTMINAESIEEAEGIAQGNPYIKSIRIYEVSDH